MGMKNVLFFYKNTSTALYFRGVYVFQKNGKT